MSESIMIAAGAAVGSMIGGFRGALVGAGLATTGLTAFRVAKGAIIIGGITYKVVRGVVGFAVFAVGRNGEHAGQGEKVDLDEGLENESGDLVEVEEVGQ